MLRNEEVKEGRVIEREREGRECKREEDKSDKRKGE